MKKIIFSLLAIVSVAAVVGVGSYALWSDVETSEDNYIQAGYMDLTMDPMTIAVGPVYPGETGSSESITVKNDSNAVDGMLSVDFDSLVDYENWCVEPEINEGADLTCSLISDTADLPNVPAEFVGADNGELSDYVMITTIEVDSDSFDVNQTVATLVAGAPFDLPAPIPAGESVGIVINWEVVKDADPSPFGDNIFMTDAVVVDAVVTLTQKVE